MSDLEQHSIVRQTRLSHHENPTLLNKSRSRLPQYIVKRPDLDETSFPEFLSYFHRLIDEAKTAGVPVFDRYKPEGIPVDDVTVLPESMARGDAELTISQLENVLAMYQEGEYNEDGLRTAVRPFISKTIDSIKTHYDETTGFIYYPDNRLRIISEILRYYGKFHKMPYIGIHVFDLDKLHEKNVKFGEKEVNKGYKALAESIAKCVDDIPLNVAEEGAVAFCRQKGTGDELLAIFVNSREANNQFLTNLEKNKWPKVTLNKLNSGGSEEVLFTARRSSLTSEDEPAKLIQKHKTDPGGIFDNMVLTAADISSGKGSKRP